MSYRANGPGLEPFPDIDEVRDVDQLEEIVGKELLHAINDEHSWNTLAAHTLRANLAAQRRCDLNNESCPCCTGSAVLPSYLAQAVLDRLGFKDRDELTAWLDELETRAEEEERKLMAYVRSKKKGKRKK